MLEILVAAFAPTLGAIFVARRFPSAERNLVTALALLPLLWFVPCWVTGRSPVSFDFLSQQQPWKELRPAGYLDRNPLLNDVPLQVIPFREEARTALLRGEIRGRSELLGGHTPLLANLQAAPFFPVNLVALPFSSFAWPLFSMLSKMLLALFGTYLFLCGIGRSPAAALFGAIAYGCSLFTIAWLAFPMTNVTVLLPLLLYSIDRLLDSDGTRRIAVAAAVLAFMLLGGHPESVLHASFAAIPYAIYRGRRAPGRMAVRSLAFGLIGILLAGVVLVPFFLYLPHSQRLVDIRASDTFLSAPPLAWDSLVPMLVPNYFGNPRAHNYRHHLNFNELCTGFVGLTTIVLAIAALIYDRRSTRLLAALIPLVLLTYPIPLVTAIVQNVPLLDITAHGRLRFVISLLLAILASRAIDLLREFTSGENADRRVKKIVRVVAAVTALVVIVILIASYPTFARVGIRRLIATTELFALAGCLLLTTAPHRSLLLSLLLTLDLFAAGGLYNPAVSDRFFYPENAAVERTQTATETHRGERVTGLGLALQPNSSTMLGLADIRPHDPLAFAPYVRFLDAVGLQRSSYFAQFETPPKPHVLDFLGTAAMFEPEEKTPLLRPTALPRFFIARTVAQSTTPAKAFTSNTSARAVYLESLPTDRVATDGSAGRITNLTMTYGQRTISFETNERTFIGSSEVALPGWVLEIDGNPSRLFTINDAFLGFVAPAGRHTATLNYTTPGASAGAILSILGVIMLILLHRPWNRRRIEAADAATLEPPPLP